MRVSTAKQIARQWVDDHAPGIPGFAGAFFHGSINWLQDDALLPATSDVDVMIVLDTPHLQEKPGKLRYHGLILEVSYLAGDQVRSPEQVLGTSHLAGSFRTASVIRDPFGALTPLQQAVARDYARRQWVERRCRHARQKILAGYPLRAGDTFPDQVTAWLFPTGITTHLLLLAGLRNPTVRTRYLAARELLAEYGHLDAYEVLLEQLGCATMGRQRAEQHLAALAEAFDAAQAAIVSPFGFAADISTLARPIAIDGSRELIARGDHREAIFWLTATASRCQQVFHRDAPRLLPRFEPAYRSLLADLGIATFADMRGRLDQVRGSLPRLWAVAEAIMAANPDIEDAPDAGPVSP